MGAINGKQVVNDDVKSYTNIPLEGIQSLWTSYTILGEGWGLEYRDLEAIFMGAEYLKTKLCLTKEMLEKLFKTFDTDDNGLVDALELISSIALCSSMLFNEKITFLLNAYDFNKKGDLSGDELALLIRSIVKGLSKMFPSQYELSLVTNDIIAQYVSFIFIYVGKSEYYNKVTVDDLIKYCSSHPVFSSWLLFFTSIPNGEPVIDKSYTLPPIQQDIKKVKFPLTYSTKLPPKIVSEGEGDDEEEETEENPKPKGYRSWFDIVDLAKPEEIPPMRKDLPQDIFEPTWIHGYSGTIRQSALYDANSKIYALAYNNILGLSKEGGEEGAPIVWTQTIISEHRYPITCFSQALDGKLLVTADDSASSNISGSEPSRIVLWDTLKMVVSGIIFIPTGAKLMDVSTDGTLLLVVLSDEFNTLNLYDLSTKSIIFSTLLGSEDVTDIAFGATNSQFAVSSGKYVDFYFEEFANFVGSGVTKSFISRKSCFNVAGKDLSNYAITSVARFVNKNEMVASTSTGDLLFFKGNNCIQVTAAHNGPVTKLVYSAVCQTLTSCGIDGRMNLYKVSKDSNSLLDKIASVDVVVNAGLGSRHINSICLHSSGTRLLVGLVSGELIEVSCVSNLVVTTQEPTAEGEAAVEITTDTIGTDVNGAPVLQSHWKSSTPDTMSPLPEIKITGLAKHATGFVSIGDDKTLRLWQTVEGQKLLKSVTLDTTCSSIATSSINVAVGLDQGRAGLLQIYGLPGLEFISEVNVSNQAITMIRLSAEGNIFAAAAAGKILVYSITDGVWNSLGEIELPGALIQMDLSADNTLLRYLCTGDEDIFGIFNVSNNPEKPFGEEVKSKEVIVAVAWASNFCPCSWDSKGVWDNVESATDMSMTDRFNSLFVQVIPDGNLNLKRVPVADYGKSPYTPVSGSITLPAHNGTITSFAFIEEGAKLVTAGIDGLIKVWKVTYDTEEVEPDIVGGEEEPPAEEDGETKKEEPVFYDSADDEDLLDGPSLIKHLSEQIVTEEKMSALHPWGPTLGVDVNSAGTSESVLPNDEIELVWAYGYTSRTARNCVKYTYDGKIIYPAASMGVIYDKVKGTQTFAMAHYDEITCLDVHVPTSIAATANKGAGNIIACVWSTDDGKILNRLNCGAVNAISAISFSPDGKLIATACQDRDHTVKLFHWQSGVMKASVVGGPQKILTLGFSNVTGANVCRILQGGEKHFQFLELVNSSSFTAKQGKYGAGIKKSNVLCVAALPLALSAEAGGNEFLMGMSDGTIGIVPRGDRRAASFAPIQKGSITSLCVIKIKDATAEEGPQFKIVSAGTDGQIKVLDQELQPLQEFDLYKKDKYGLYGMGKLRGIKSLCVDKANRKIMYGTTAGEIGEIAIENGANINEGTNLLVNGHFRDELHAVSSNPVRQECVTAGDDRTLRIWDLETHSMKTMIELPDNARAVSFSPNGQTIVAGLGGALVGSCRRNLALNNGRIVVVSYLQGVLNIVHTTKNAENAITSIVFSPDGSMAYISSLDCNIYVYDVLDNFNLKNTFKLHTEGIKSMDISNDARYLMSVGIEGEVIVWSIESSSPIPEASRAEILAQVVWYNRQNTCGKDTIGIFPPNSKFSDISTFCNSKDKTICATGDVYGAIKLFKNPVTGVNAPYKFYSGHTSGGVAKTIFTKQDQFLLSIGRDDKVLLQWAVKKSTVLGEPVIRETLSIPPVAPVIDNTFDESFIIDGINFVENQKPPKEIVEKLSVTGVIGSGAKTSAGTVIDQSYYCGTGDIVTSCGKLLYSFKSDKITQNMWQYSEKETIACMVVSSCGMITVVGTNMNGNGTLRLYNSTSGVATILLSDEIKGGITACAISSDNQMIACLGDDEQSSLYIFTTNNKVWNEDSLLLYSGAVSNRKTKILSFIPMSGMDLNEFTLVTAGDDNIKFWAVKGRNVHYTIGDVYITPNPEIPEQPVTSIVPSTKVQSVVVGHADGSLMLWTGAAKQGCLGSHSGPITALRSFSTGFVSVSNDVVKIWKDGWYTYVEREYSVAAVLEKIKRSDLVRDIGIISSIDIDLFNRRLLLNYTTGLLVEYAMDSEAIVILSEGFSSQISMLCPHPTEPHTIATLHEDRTLKLFDLSMPRRGPTASILLYQQPTAMTFLDAKTLLIGVVGQDNTDTNGASMLIIELNEMSTDAKLSVPGPYVQQSKTSLDRPLTMTNKILNIGKGTITKIISSPDKKKIVICNSDKNIYIYDVTDYSQVSRLSMGNGDIPVTADVSSCSKYMRAFSQYADLSAKVTVCYYNIESGNFNTNINTDISINTNNVNTNTNTYIPR